MKTKLGFCLASVVVLAAPVFAAMSPLSAAGSALSINGAAAGVVLGWDGGDVHLGAPATGGVGTAGE